jgi:hypothetical protein
LRFNHQNRATCLSQHYSSGQTVGPGANNDGVVRWHRTTIICVYWLPAGQA